MTIESKRRRRESLSDAGHDIENFLSIFLAAGRIDHYLRATLSTKNHPFSHSIEVKNEFGKEDRDSLLLV